MAASNGNDPVTNSLTGKGLDMEQVMNLLSKTRTRNGYEPKLTQFIESDEPGIDIQDAWPEFAGKQATTLYQGFNSAISKMELRDVVKLSQLDGHVYLFHYERAGIAVSAEAVEAS